MIEHKFSLVIRRPVSEVFVFAIDPEQAPRWRSGIVSARRMSSGAEGVGATEVAVRRFLGRRVEIGYVVTEFDRDRRFALRTTSGPAAMIAYTFEPVAEGTRVHVSGTILAGGLLRLFAPVLAPSLKRDLEGSFGRLKVLLEGAT